MIDGGFLFYPIEELEKKIIPGNIKDSHQNKKKEVELFITPRISLVSV